MISKTESSYSDICLKTDEKQEAKCIKQMHCQHDLVYRLIKKQKLPN